MAKRTSDDAQNSAPLEPGIYKPAYLTSIKAQTLEKGGYQILTFTFRAKEGFHSETIFKPTLSTDDKLDETAKLARLNKTIDHAVDTVLAIAERINNQKMESGNYEYGNDFDWDAFTRDAQALFPTNYSTVPLQIKLVADVFKAKPRVQFSYFTQNSIQRMDATDKKGNPIELKFNAQELADLAKYNEIVSLQNDQTPVDTQQATESAAGFLAKRKLKPVEAEAEKTTDTFDFPPKDDLPFDEPTV